MPPGPPPALVVMEVCVPIAHLVEMHDLVQCRVATLAPEVWSRPQVPLASEDSGPDSPLGGPGAADADGAVHDDLFFDAIEDQFYDPRDAIDSGVESDTDQDVREEDPPAYDPYLDPAPPDEDEGPSDDDADEPAPVEVGDNPKPPKKRTGAWYHYHQFTSITPDHGVRVIDVCFWLARWKSQNRVSDKAMDEMCQMIHYLLLPAHNMVPPSYHLIRCALGVPPAEDCVRHVCDKCWTLFPPLSADLFKDHQDEVCGTPGCDHPRFRIGAAGQVAPNRRVWYFGEEETLADLLSKDGVLDAMMAYRKDTWHDPDAYWASPAARLLNNRCRGLLRNTDLSDEIVVPVTAGTCCATAQRFRLLPPIPKLYWFLFVQAVTAARFLTTKPTELSFGV